MKDKTANRPRGRRARPAMLDRIHPHAAGIDCGATTHVVAVPPTADPVPVRSFRTFTPDLHQLADWLIACGVTTVALEATGVYWIPIFELLEERGLAVLLVNPHHVKHVPGRKSDVADCEWLRDLHTVGLVRGSFRPPEAFVALRAYLRHRQTLVASASTCVHRMQKALTQMNLQLPLVLSDLTGQTGMRILRDIVAGQRDPARLAAHRDRRCHATVAQITAALTGHYRAEHLFVLQQHLALFDLYQTQLAACDAAIAAHVATLTATVAPPPTALPAPRVPLRPRGHEPTFEIRTPLHHLTGVDLTQIEGLGPYTALKILSEIGTDMRRWPSAKHFTSWLTLAPQNKVSGGRILSARTAPSANRAAAAFRLAAMALTRTQTAFGAFYRRLAFRVGKAKAITALARKLAVVVYHMLNGDFVYQAQGAAAYEAHDRERTLKHLRQRATALGFDLVNVTTGELAPGHVS